jgi:PKHD-type hydroxylase
VLEDRLEDRAIRLGPGEAVLYPSTSLHRVEPVQSGTRLAVVGWITSRVRDAGQREILMDLDEAIMAQEAMTPNPAQLARLARTRSNLLRMWAD